MHHSCRAVCIQLRNACPAAQSSGRSALVRGAAFPLCFAHRVRIKSQHKTPLVSPLQAPRSVCAQSSVIAPEEKLSLLKAMTIIPRLPPLGEDACTQKTYAWWMCFILSRLQHVSRTQITNVINTHNILLASFSRTVHLCVSLYVCVCVCIVVGNFP